MYDYKSPLDTMYQPRPKPQTGKATAIKVATAFGAVALVGIAGISVASHCGYAIRHQEMAPVAAVEPAQFREQLPAILRRENADESIPGLQPYDYSATVDSSVSVASGNAAARATGDDASKGTDPPVGVSVPVMTPTSLNTVYTIRTPDANTTTVVIIPSATHTCTSQEPDETSTVMVTVTVVPEQTQQPPPAYGSSSLPSGVTVTGNPATVTDVQTDTHYTSGAPDATVSGTPATVTDVQTDTRFTSGAPDATVSGEPATVTSVITNTAGEPMTTLTFTSTLRITVTTVTRSRSSSSVDVDSSVLGLPHTTTGYPSNPAVTHTTTVTVTDGAPVTSTTTVELPEPYGGEYPTPWGTGLPINATASPTYVPPVVSAGSEACGCSMVYLAIAAVASLCLV